jgi:hypothetical protein
MPIPKNFLIRLEREVRQGELTLEQAYEAAFHQIKPSKVAYRKEMKPHLDTLQAWYEQLAPELGANLCSIIAPSATPIKAQHGRGNGSPGALYWKQNLPFRAFSKDL